MKGYPMRAGIALLGAVLSVHTVAAAENAGLASPWMRAENSRVRLAAARGNGPDGRQHLFAGLEIEMADGWKTYWRNPGSSGVPPHFDWSESENLAHARALFPAPTRFEDRDGDTIGYKHAVVFPIEIEPRDPAKPVRLVLSVEYGICRDICIPVELKLTLALPTAETFPSEDGVVAALARVPRPAASRRPNDPELKSAKAELGGAAPRLTIEAAYPGGAAGADLFVEPPGGLWVPLAKKTGTGPADLVRFEIDLTDGVDVAELKGKTLRLTFVSDAGQSEASLKLD